MKRIALVISVVFVGVALFLVGCEKPTAELERAEKALQAARDAGAKELAPSDYTAAENKLNEGKELIDKIKYNKAKTALEESAQLAEIARQKALSAKAQPATQPPVEAKKVETPAPAPAPAPAKSGYSDYTVKKGDCLWNISKKGDIYGDAYLWPLIYDSNKDQIKDPNLIYPNQVLKIKLDATDEEKKSARKRAGAGK